MTSPLFSVALRRSIPVVVAAGLAFALGRYTAHSHERVAPAATKPKPFASSPAAAPAAGPDGTEATAGLKADEMWQRWSNHARSAEVERELSASIEEMAKRAPARAWALAASEPTLRGRELLRNAALRGWATMAPDAAMAAAMKLPGIDNRAAVAAVLQGAAVNVDAAVRLGRQVADGTDPVALDYGRLAISALADHGYFEAAVRFAADGPAANQALWLNTAFTVWARTEPQQALAGLERITDPALRHDAQEGLRAGWAESDPASLADYALRVAPGEDRAAAFAQTLTNWVWRDPASASQWLSQRDPDPGLDPGVSAVASLQPLIARRPDAAAEWAQAITEPQLRRDTFRTIGQQWRRESPGALQQYLNAHSRLSDADRDALTGSN